MVNQNIIIRPTVAEVNGQLVESYERITNASTEQIEALGLDPVGQYYAKVGIAPVNEYVRLMANDIKQGKRQSWDLSAIGQALQIESIYIDSPTQDSFDLEVYDQQGDKPLDLTIGGSEAPYNFPKILLTTDLILKIYARKYIKTVRIFCRPAIVLADYLSESEFVTNGTKEEKGND